MEIYFVRHGQTGGNAAKRHQLETTPLTATGGSQAAAAASYIATLAPTHLIASDRVRAIETARAVAATTGLDTAIDAVFTELIRPQTIYGHKHRSVRSLWYLSKWFLGLHGNGPTEIAGESYRDLRARIVAAQSTLAALPANAKVVVVSHAIFINMFLAHMCHPRPLMPWAAVRCFQNILKIKNGSVTHIRYEQTDEKKCRWQLVSYAHDAHLIPEQNLAV